MMKNLLLGKVRDAMKEGGISLVTLTLDEKGELEIKSYDKRQVVLPEDQYLELQNTIKNLLQ